MAEIEITVGDVLATQAEAVVNTVNCVGIMGRGIALQFKKAYPANFDAYARACQAGAVVPGRMFVFETGYLSNPKWIINFPTKRHWRGKSRIEDVEQGLIDLARVIVEKRIGSIAIPPLGAGLGGLPWSDVRPRIEQALSGLPDLHILIFEPGGAPDAKVMARTTEAPKMTAGRAALVVLISRYLNGFMDPFITLLEIHKLLFFMQEQGQGLRLQFKKAPMGPYAENLRHVLNAIEGHLLSGYADGGDQPDKALALVPGAVDDAEKFLAEDRDTMARFERVAELVEGYETPFGLELLSTVYWVTAREQASTVEEVVERVHSWNPRKRMFSKDQIAGAYETLRDKRWMS